MEFDAWYEETFDWLKSQYSAPRVRCNRGIRKRRVDARPRRNPHESVSENAARAPDVIPLCNLEADLEDVLNESNRKRPPSPLPLADADAGDGILTGTGRVRRVRRRRDLPSAYMEVYPVNQQPAAQGVQEPHVESEATFTPTAVNDGTRCLARTWNNGCGGQCALPPDAGSEVCKRHVSEQQQSHGLVTGPIPPQKLQAFRRAHASRVARDARMPATEEGSAGPATDAASSNPSARDYDGAQDVEATAPNRCDTRTGEDTPGRADDDEIQLLSPERSPIVDPPPSLGLGDRVPGVPLAVHERMEELLRQQMIPRTTSDQRLRRGTTIRTRGTSYDVHPMLREAFNYGYTSPNFPDAPLARWMRQPGMFQLRRFPRGG